MVNAFDFDAQKLDPFDVEHKLHLFRCVTVNFLHNTDATVVFGKSVIFVASIMEKCSCNISANKI
jgi:hypothetical protein